MLHINLTIVLKLVDVEEFGERLFGSVSFDIFSLNWVMHDTLSSNIIVVPFGIYHMKQDILDN